MQVNIGPYKNWFGPYQLVKPLEKFFSRDFCDWLAEKIPLAPFEWIDSKRKRHIKIVIEPYDTWSMDHTLSLIITPMLKQLRDTKHGSPFVSDDDVPVELQSKSAPPKEDETDVDANFHKRWEYVINEMIFSFEQCSKDDFPPSEEYDRIQNGFRLFGKYYNDLWD